MNGRIRHRVASGCIECLSAAACAARNRFKQWIPHDSQKRALKYGGYAAASVGAAGLVGAGVFTGISLSQQCAVDDHCTGHACDPEGLAAARRGASFLRLADVALVVGGVGMATGGILIWHSSKIGLTAHVSGSAIAASARWSLP